MIDPKTGLEINNTPKYEDTLQQTTDIRGNTDNYMPAGAKSLTASSNVGVPKIGNSQGDKYTMGFNLDKINQYAQQNNTGGIVSNTSGQLGKAIGVAQSNKATGNNLYQQIVGVPNIGKLTPDLSQVGVTVPTAKVGGTLPPQDIGQGATNVQTPVIPSTPTTTPSNAMPITKPDYMSQADWDKIQTEGAKNIKDTYASYNLAKGQYEENKNYYTNFDEKNNQYTNVLNSLQTAQSQNQNAPLTDAQYQNIASQYGLTIDQVKNPLKIFSDPNTGLKMTDEGKRKLGVTMAEQNIADATTQFERNKADLAIKTQQTQDQFQQQIDDVQKNLQRNIDWMNAQGAWSGANKSSGYVQGIQNVAQDGQTTINRLKTLAEQARTADATTISRLTDDFNKGITRAKTNLDDQMKQVNQSAGLQLAGLTEQYGLGNKTLTTALDKIMQDMDSKTAEAQGKYIANLKAIQGIATTNIENFTKIKDLNDKIANQRTDELLKNNGAILQNTSLTTLSESVKNGEISPQKYSDLKSYMLYGIQTALGKLGTVTTEDTHTIEHLLETGSTPAQIIAKMQGTGRFTSENGPKLQTITYTDAEGNEIKQTGYMDANNVWHPVNSTGTTTAPSGATQTGGISIDLSKLKPNDGINPDTGKPFVTVRNNNPTNMSMDVLVSLVGRDKANEMATTGEQFTNGSNIYYAKFNGNALDQTIQALDTAAQDPNKRAFYTQGGSPRWTYAQMSDEKWLGMTPEQKKAYVMGMNKQEGYYSGFATGENPATTTTATPATTTPSFNEFQTNVMANWDGKDVKKLAQDLGVSKSQARSMYDQFKTDSKLSPNDQIILGSFLKDISGSAVSAAERAIYTEQYLDMKKKGMNQQEIMNQLALYVPTDVNKDNQSVKNQLAELQPYAVGVGIDGMKEIAQKINNKNYNGAVTTLENAYYKKAGVNSSDITDIGNNVKNGNNLVTRINTLKEKFGPIAGNEAKWAQYVKDDKETQRLLSDMTNFVAKYRNGIAGTSVTTNEEDFLNNIIPSITNNPDNAIAKIESNTSQAFNGLNTIRDNVGLPTLKDPRSSYDISFRKQVYAGGNKGTQQKALVKPTQDQIAKATPKVIADITAGKSLADMKQHAVDLGVDPQFVEDIYNKQKGTATQTPKTGNIMDRIKALRNQ